MIRLKDFSLNIVDQQEQSIYHASFCFLSLTALLIASIQGPNHDQAQQTVRNATKKHGVRPMFMLLNAFKLLSQILNCELYGIPHKNKQSIAGMIIQDYCSADEFWQENQANLANKTVTG